jgi:TetR/AcrR family transcriptional regulator, transcriptional repressor for nem operon
VARYSKEHKAATRQRIIDAAGRRLKKDGIDGSGVATLMADAGLTNGAFYAHFDSKDDLVTAVIADQIGRQVTELSELPPGRRGLELFVRQYLSRGHRDHPEAGCPSAALLDEVGRCTPSTKEAYTVGTQAILREISSRLAPEQPESALPAALSLFTILVGSMQLARALTDRELSDVVLDEGVVSAQAILEASTAPA